MATAIAVGSLLSSGGSALAGAGLISATGIAGVGFGTISAGLGIAGQVLSFFDGQSAADAAFESQIAASRAELEASRARFAEGQVSIQRERTQAALEEEERQRRLRRVLAEQRANFAGGSADPFSGSPQAIQENTVGEINRETRLAELATQDRIQAINTQGLGILATGKGRAASLIGNAVSDLNASNQRGREQLAGIAGDIGEFGEILK